MCVLFEKMIKSEILVIFSISAISASFRMIFAPIDTSRRAESIGDVPECFYGETSAKNQLKDLEADIAVLLVK